MSMMTLKTKRIKRILMIMAISLTQPGCSSLSKPHISTAQRQAVQEATSPSVTGENEEMVASYERLDLQPLIWTRTPSPASEAETVAPSPDNESKENSPASERSAEFGNKKPGERTKASYSQWLMNYYGSEITKRSEKSALSEDRIKQASDISDEPSLSLAREKANIMDELSEKIRTDFTPGKPDNSGLMHNKLKKIVSLIVSSPGKGVTEKTDKSPENTVDKRNDDDIYL